MSCLHSKQKLQERSFCTVIHNVLHHDSCSFVPRNKPYCNVKTMPILYKISSLIAG